jgi:hypothetical protein
MTQRNLVVIFYVSALGFAVPLASCGDFGDGDGAAGTGGSSVGTGGSSAGTGGSSAGTGGSSAGTGGTAGSTGNEPPPDASCDNVVGCGGDVVGVWFAVDSCLTVSGTANLAALGIGCTEGTADGTLAVSGNWRVGDDGTLTDTTQTTGTIKLGLGPECKDVSGTVTQCDAIGGPLASLGFTESACVDSATIEGGCDCTGTVDQAGAAAFVTFDVASMGLYAIDGNALTFTGYEVVDYDYCVDGNFMHMTPTTVNDIGTVSGTIVFQKQP